MPPSRKQSNVASKSGGANIEDFEALRRQLAVVTRLKDGYNAAVTELFNYVNNVLPPVPPPVPPFQSSRYPAVVGVPVTMRRNDNEYLYDYWSVDNTFNISLIDATMESSVLTVVGVQFTRTYGNAVRQREGTPAISPPKFYKIRTFDYYPVDELGNKYVRNIFLDISTVREISLGEAFVTVPDMSLCESLEITFLDGDILRINCPPRCTLGGGGAKKKSTAKKTAGSRSKK